MEFQDTASSIDRKFTFSEAELGAIRQGLKTGLYTGTESREVRNEKWRDLLSGLCIAFNIPIVKLEFVTFDKKGAGSYCSKTKTIIVGSRYSLVTLLHYFILALLDARQRDTVFVEMVSTTGLRGLHELTAAFALSLFREAAPEMYEKAKQEGKLIYLKELERAAAGPSRRDDDDQPEPKPGAMKPDTDPENRVDRGNGFGED